MTQERHINPEKPFAGRKVYFSNSIKGVPDIDPNFGYNLVQFMMDKGADVLSEHVGGRTQEERDKIFARRAGADRRKVNEPWYLARKVDMGWVDEATHVIAVVNSPSLGVGMEIERALLKPERGLNETAVLCLVREDLQETLSYMVRGVNQEEAPQFKLVTYKDEEEAKSIISDFLQK